MVAALHCSRLSGSRGDQSQLYSTISHRSLLLIWERKEEGGPPFTLRTDFPGHSGFLWGFYSLCVGVSCWPVPSSVMWGVRSGGKQARSLVYDIVGILPYHQALSGDLWDPSLCACQHHLSKGGDEDSRSQRVGRAW